METEGYMQSLIDRAHENGYLQTIHTPGNLSSGCGSAAKVGSKEYTQQQFLGRLGGQNENAQQQDLLAAFNADIFTPDEITAIYEFVKANSMAEDSNIVMESSVFQQALSDVVARKGRGEKLLWPPMKEIVMNRISDEIKKGRDYDTFYRHIMSNEISEGAKERITSYARTLEIEITKAKATPAKSAKTFGKKKRGGSRKKKSTRRRNKTYRRRY